MPTARIRVPRSSRDLPYKGLLTAFGVLVAGTVTYYVYIIIDQSIPGWHQAGWHFFTSTDWNFGANKFGALPLIIGTLLVTALALLLAVPVGIGSALAIVFLIPRRLRLIVGSAIELLAVVPSIIFGLWGIYVIGPWMEQHADPWLEHTFHNTWPFDGLYQPVGLYMGVMVLAVMILPTITAISRDVLVAFPKELVEGGLSVGATRAQVLRKVVLPSTRSGLVGAVSLGTARALGETVALYILLGNVSIQHPIPSNLFSPLGTLATEIALNFGSFAGGTGVLCCLGVVLMVIVGSVNLAGRYIIRRQLVRLAP